ncbi:uncharacterized protein LOC134215062 [Armigeres subalbatus]|uniref:uncharacterized protein LOC134215062 n=1 Tax=Armigeres subalbatus TaxID=124917 RepID=UPI002ED04E4E
MKTFTLICLVLSCISVFGKPLDSIEDESSLVDLIEIQNDQLLDGFEASSDEEPEDNIDSEDISVADSLNDEDDRINEILQEALESILRPEALDISDEPTRRLRICAPFYRELGQEAQGIPLWWCRCPNGVIC